MLTGFGQKYPQGRSQLSGFLLKHVEQFFQEIQSITFVYILLLFAAFIYTECLNEIQDLI